MARRGTFAFDLSAPMKKGTLLKQGHFHRAFRFRFFVLYPGFLVYYGEETKWKLDITRGETLQSRQGAIKLKNGSVNIARQAPKGCKFGLIVHGPDPQNKRPTYLLNAASKEDRDAWIEAIKNNTPQSPKNRRKSEATPKDLEKKKDKDELVPPQYTCRQDTVDVAATVAAEASVNNPHEQSTSIDQELLAEPSLTVRRDTTNIAALALSKNMEDTDMNELLEESEPVTSIDDVLGIASDGYCSEEDILDEDLTNGTNRTSSDPVPESESIRNPDSVTENQQESKTEELEADSIPMDTKEKVLSSVNSQGKIEVETIVTVACTSNGDSTETGDNERGNDVPSVNGLVTSEDQNETQASDSKVASSEGETTAAENGQSEEHRKESTVSQSSEVIISSEDPSNSFSVTVVVSSEDGEDSDSDESGFSSPPPTEPLQENGLSTLSESVTSEPTTPTIIVESAAKADQNESNHSSGDEVVKLPPPAQHRRRSSAPFIQKVGHLYKLGGHHKNWKRRYFILTPGTFLYYKNPNTKQPLGEVKLKNINIFFPASGERKTSYQFVIHTESQWNKRSDWVLAAQSEREMKEWITAFKLAGQKSISPNSSPLGSDEDDLA